MIHENWAYVGAAIYVLGTITYLVDMFRGKAQPNRVTWGVLTVAPMIAFASMLSKEVSLGQSITTFSFGFAPFMIFVTTFLVKHPAWKIKQFDIICGALSFVGLILWWITGEGNVAIVFAILADLLGFTPTIVKSFTNPESESPWAYIASEIATILGFLVITSWDFEHVAFLVYIFTANMIAIALIYFRLGTYILARR